MKFKFSAMRWIATLVGVQMLCGIVWVLGPLLAPLESQEARFGVLIGIVLIWAVANLLLDWLRSRQENALTQGVAGAADEEVAAVGAKLATALTRSRTSSLQRLHVACRGATGRDDQPVRVPRF